MKFIIIVLIFLAQACLFAQEISFSKDSLFFIPSEYNNYHAVDTLWMYNDVSKELIVDSIISANYYGYRLEVIYSDSTILYDYILDTKLNLTLFPQDSMMLIISGPDICPICKSDSRFIMYTDTIVFINNSHLNPRYNIFTFIDENASIDDEEKFALKIELHQNYPNPFNPTTTIKFYLPKPEHLSIEIFNSLGQRILYLINEKISAGTHQVTFNGNDFSSGIYFYKLTAGNFTKIRKMLLIK